MKKDIRCPSCNQVWGYTGPFFNELFHAEFISKPVDIVKRIEDLENKMEKHFSSHMKEDFSRGPYIERTMYNLWREETQRACDLLFIDGPNTHKVKGILLNVLRDTENR
jgi:hypothetical protein